MNSKTPLPSLEEFCRLIAHELQLDEKLVRPQSSFIDDLLVDSIRMIEIMFRLEDMGFSIPPEKAWEIKTVEDAYKCYVEQYELASGLREDLTATKPAGAGSA